MWWFHIRGCCLELLSVSGQHRRLGVKPSDQKQLQEVLETGMVAVHSATEHVAISKPVLETGMVAVHSATEHVAISKPVLETGMVAVHSATEHVAISKPELDSTPFILSPNLIMLCY